MQNFRPSPNRSGTSLRGPGEFFEPTGALPWAILREAGVKPPKFCKKLATHSIIGLQNRSRHIVFKRTLCLEDLGDAFGAAQFLVAQREFEKDGSPYFTWHLPHSYFGQKYRQTMRISAHFCAFLHISVTNCTYNM